jgi:hypothetical protein
MNLIEEKKLIINQLSISMPNPLILPFYQTMHARGANGG